MRKRAVWPLAVLLGVFAISCGTPESEQTSATSVVTATGPTAATTGPTTTTEPAADGEEVEAYLVEMSNLAADSNTQQSEFECSYNEQFSPGFCGVEFVEEGEEYEPPPEPTEEEQFEYQRGYWLGSFELHLAQAEALDAVEPPPGFELAHREYVDAFRSYFTYLYDQIAGFTNLTEFISFFDAIFDPLAELPAEQEQLLLAMVDSCRSLEDLGTDAGFRTDLGCPSPPEEPVSIEVEVDGQWSATPNPLPVGDGLVQMTITNTGSEAIRPVVLDIFEGDPVDLPIIDGVVDLSRSGVSFDASSRFSYFGIVYPGHEMLFGEDSTVLGEPPELLPGESIEAVIWSEGTMVVFDYQPGGFETGAYVVVERSGT
jgi:hypothetical protein